MLFARMTGVLAAWGVAAAFKLHRLAFQADTVDLIPKTKLELVLADAVVEQAVQAIMNAARTGKIGDGKIFLSRVDDAIRIRNEERGEGAL